MIKFANGRNYAVKQAPVNLGALILKGGEAHGQIELTTPYRRHSNGHKHGINRVRPTDHSR